jgi:SAM-dependent MidA family methyltransferase
MLRNRLLAQATLRESTGGTKEIIEEARKALANKQSREQAQTRASLQRLLNETSTGVQHGYYMRRRVFGEKGDFTTAPEISQVFGEMVLSAALCKTAGKPSAP